MKFHVCEDILSKENIVDVPYDIQKFCIWLKFFEESDILKIVNAISNYYCWEDKLSEKWKCLFHYEDIPR